MKSLENIAMIFQTTYEEVVGKRPYGTCHLIGHCMNEILNELGYESRKVTGKLALLMKSSKSKYVMYGKLNLKGKMIGDYHTWCEVRIEDKILIVDSSLKYNRKFLKQCSISLHGKIKNSNISDEANTFHIKYTEDMALDEKSNHFLSTVDDLIIASIISSTLDKLGQP